MRDEDEGGSRWKGERGISGWRYQILNAVRSEPLRVRLGKGNRSRSPSHSYVL